MYGDANSIFRTAAFRAAGGYGTDRGTCTSVIDNPAHDILELEGGWLVPWAW